MSDQNTAAQNGPDSAGWEAGPRHKIKHPAVLCSTQKLQPVGADGQRNTEQTCSTAVDEHTPV